MEQNCMCINKCVALKLHVQKKDVLEDFKKVVCIDKTPSLAHHPLFVVLETS